MNKVNDRISSYESKLSSIENISKDHEKTLSLLTRSNQEQKELIIAQGIIISEEQKKTMECMNNIKELFIESNELKQLAKDQMKDIEKLNIETNENRNEIIKLKEQTNENIKKLDSISKILNEHTEILAEHSKAIASIQSTIFENSGKIEEICKILYGHEQRISNLENEISNINKILNAHQEAINKIFSDMDELKAQVNLVMNKVNSLEEKIINDNIKIKKDRIGDFVDKMSEEQMYEFATFILELRAGNNPYNLDIVLDGAKMILGYK